MRRVSKTSRANRGKYAEKKVQDHLKNIERRFYQFSSERLPDARAAMGRFKSMAADFAWYCPGLHGLIECKETEHDFRLPKAAVPQLTRMKLRILSGGTCYLVIYHSELKKWRCIDVNDMEIIERGSWDFRDHPLYDTLDEALPIERFGLQEKTND